MSNTREGTWQQRNRILYQGHVQWLTVPVQRAFLGQHIQDVMIDPNQNNWRKKHAATLFNAYRNATHFSDVKEVIEMIASGGEVRLSELNINLTNYFCQRLQILTPRFVAHHFSMPSQRIERLKSLCQLMKCDEYFSPMGAKKYLTDDGFEIGSDIRLHFQSFYPKPYVQSNINDFTDRLSIVDVVAHCGFHGARQYILSQ
ncbi:WbqC family protein [Chitinibacter sp. FCG-7]|uniref:WbqC family protein n=1 Tax=Chitinibacter mangrovi TaxID=3153927 RepID=A0AAU7FA61_9NEIS